MSVRLAFRISGRVQGVGYRWWARETAAGLGLRGIVRNEPDGTVHLEAAGAREDLDRLEKLLSDGPPHARVQEVRQQTPGSEPLPPGFEITG
jgi:acylphosphatase